MGALYNILSYSVGSLFIGIVITIAGVALMFYLIKSWYSNSTFTPLSFIIGAVLFCMLAFQSVLLCGAVTIKSYCTDVEVAIGNMVERVPELAHFDRGDSQQILDNISAEWPLVGYYLDWADFTGHTPVTIAHVMADEMRSYMNWFILRRLGWSLLFVVLGAFGVIKSMDVARRRSSGRHHARRRSYDD